MGQDMIISTFTFRRDRSTGRASVNFAAAREALDAVPDAKQFLWDEPEEVIFRDDFVAASKLHEGDADYDPLDDIVPNRAFGHAILRDLEDALEGRQVSTLTVGAWDIYVAGGLSWGDEPSDAFEVFNWAWQLPTSVLTALGVRSPQDDPDAEALDKLAIGLGTTSEWSSDELEWIATVIGEVRPNPGFGDRQEYLTKFTQSRGFDPRERPDLVGYIDDSTDDSTDTAEDE